MIKRKHALIHKTNLPRSTELQTTRKMKLNSLEISFMVKAVLKWVADEKESRFDYLPGVSNL